MFGSHWWSAIRSKGAKAMISARNYPLVAGALIGAVALLVPLAAPAQSNCQWYASTALRQQQQNEKLKCGLRGESWHSDLKAHLTWCAGVSPDLWKAQAQARDQQLAACAAKAN